MLEIILLQFFYLHASCLAVNLKYDYDIVARLCVVVLRGCLWDRWRKKLWQSINSWKNYYC